MKSIALLLWTLLLTFKVYGQVSTQNQLSKQSSSNDSLIKKEWEIIEYTDTVSKQHVKNMIRYKNGIKFETRESYYPNGQLSTSESFKNDTLDGIIEFHETDGKTVHRYVYEMGKRAWYILTYEGKVGYSEVYLNGKAVYSMTVDENGQFTGIGTIKQ
ncbi:hypothetical protein BH09BAC5_BH09BAC5_11650 [soil metagenome]